MHLCRLSRVTDWHGENTVLKNKSKRNSKHSVTHAHPNKNSQTNKQTNKMANGQFNQTIQSDIRPLQSDIKFLVLIPINPTDLDQVHLPGFSVNQLKVPLAPFFFYGWSSRLGSTPKTKTNNRSRRPASATDIGGETVFCHLPVNISDRGNDFSSIYQGTN